MTERDAVKIDGLRRRDVDRGSGLFQLPTRGSGPGRDAGVAQSVESVAGQRTVVWAPLSFSEAANEDAVVVRGPQFAGLVVISQALHKRARTTCPLFPRAHVLAAVRRATLLVRQANQGSTSRIVSPLPIRRDPRAMCRFRCYRTAPMNRRAARRHTFSRALSSLHRYCEGRRRWLAFSEADRLIDRRTNWRCPSGSTE